MRGIGCESCHGAARQWIGVHYERDVDRERLRQLGLIDTKNLLVRARHCAACHVGSADQDMNHDMIAAGHPPLRFELASYEALLARKHWDDRPRRIAEPDYELQLGAAGRIAAAEAALAVLEGRALRAGQQGSGDRGQGTGDRGQGPWPELAESNCFACHQALRSTVGELPLLASPERKPGVAPWQSWNVALVSSVVGGNSPTENERPGSFGQSLARLRRVMESSFSPPPAEIASLAAAARAALRQGVHIDSRGQVLDQMGRPLDVSAVLESWPASLAALNWDEACQQVAALVAVQRSILDANERSIAGRDERIGRVVLSLRFVSPGGQWPATFAQLQSSPDATRSALTMTQISRELEEIRRELLAPQTDQRRYEP